MEGSSAHARSHDRRGEQVWADCTPCHHGWAPYTPLPSPKTARGPHYDLPNLHILHAVKAVTAAAAVCGVAVPRMTTRGPPSRAMATHSIRKLPPDQSPMRRFASSVRPMSDMTARTGGRAAGIHTTNTTTMA